MLSYHADLLKGSCFLKISCCSVISNNSMLVVCTELSYQFIIWNIGP